MTSDRPTLPEERSMTLGVAKMLCVYSKLIVEPTRTLKASTYPVPMTRLKMSDAVLVRPGFEEQRDYQWQPIREGT